VTDRDAFIALNQVSGLGAVTVKRMMNAFGSAAAIFEVSERDLLGIHGIGQDRARAFIQGLKTAQADGEAQQADTLGVTLVTWADPTYPSLLKKIADPPLVLYVAGSAAALSAPSVAIIGTRQPTVYGREFAQRLGFQLAGAGYVVVSGLARGIDTEAHRGAIKSGGRTVAVVGGALDCLYPKENESLAKEISEKTGAVISEYPFGRKPDRQTFPMRNRIVSGLVRGVVVVEAPLGSGTLITVDQALDQGRSVMAVPGRADSPASQGCHQLIRNGARLVTSADDILEELQDLLPGVTRSSASTEALTPDSPAPTPPVTGDEAKLLNVLEQEPTHIDALIRTSDLPAGTVNALLIGLKIKRRVKLLPGGMVALEPRIV